MVVDLYEAALAKVLEAQDAASREFPSVLVAGHRTHIFQQDGFWEVWLNTEERDFDGLCLARSRTRHGAVTTARVTALAVSGFLQTQVL